MIIIHCRYRVSPESRAAWVESSRRMALLSRAEKGCLGYAFSFDIIDPDIAYVYERWENQELLDAHIAAPHHDARKQELKQWTIEYQEIAYYSVTPIPRRAH